MSIESTVKSVGPNAAADCRSQNALVFLRPLASLRLTVGLFLASILLIMVGTLAQVDKNMWEVLDAYFRTWWAWIDFQVFLPRSFFPSAPQVPGGFWFLGGKSLGTLLFANLLAAHLLRFRVTARGTRLLVGLAVTALGLAMIGLVIALGQNRNGLQGQPLISWGALWQLLRWSSAVVWISLIALLMRMDRRNRFVWWSCLAGCLVTGLLAFYLVVTGAEPQLSDSSLRIIWQLLQGGVAGGVLLAGCVLLFKQRGGIVVIHTAVGLLMLSELLVSLTAVEEQMVIREGEAVNFALESAQTELAVVDVSGAEFDEVTAIPGWMIQREQLIQDDSLPFDIEPLAYYKNARLREVQGDEPNLATAGIGLRFLAEELRGTSGATSDGVDVAAAYVRVTPKDDPNSAAVYLLSQQFGDARIFSAVDENLPEKMIVGGRRIEVSLRQKRNYKPFTVRLDDLKKDDYLGTDTPRDYSSYITLNDPQNNVVDQQIRIWMNNPLRYAGQTFYQTNYAKLPNVGEVTTLSVVTNTGWMIPYVACMLALIGMTAHFLGSLGRFVRRLQADAEREQVDTERGSAAWAGWLPPVVAAGLCGLFLLPACRPASQPNGMNIEAFGRLPIVYQGRAKPIDTYARNTLKIVSNKQSYYDKSLPKPSGRPSRQAATKWLLDVATQLDRADDHAVFYIPDLDVQNTLGLKPQKHFRYSLNQFRDQLGQFDTELQKARQNDVDLLTHAQRKLIEVGRRLHNFRRLVTAFRPLPFPALPSAELRKENPERAEAIVRELAEMAMQAPQINAALLADQPPLAVPHERDQDPQWLPYSVAMNQAFVATTLQRGQPQRNLIEWNRILDAYQSGNADEFNRAVGSYAQRMESSPPDGVDMRRIRFEALFNRIQPFTLCAGLYVLAFLMNGAAWLGWFEPLRRTAGWLIVFTFLLHTAALVARIYISGRPPVTNLYSSAIFIGWGMVLFCIVLERIFPISIANLVATLGGFSTLLIAQNLAGDGDTFTVLQAVLDTQFWLATHVVCITLGYSATFLAGALGAVYLVGSLLVPGFSPEFADAMPA